LIFDEAGPSSGLSANLNPLRGSGAHAPAAAYSMLSLQY